MVVFSCKSECPKDRRDKVLECELQQTLSLHLRAYLQELVVEARALFKRPFPSINEHYPLIL